MRVRARVVGAVLVVARAVVQVVPVTIVINDDEDDDSDDGDNCNDVQCARA